MKTKKVYIELLILKVQNGDQHAWNNLLAICQVKVKVFTLKFLGPTSDVDDCIQDALLTIFNKINQLKDPTIFHTWLYRIVYSKCMDHCRKYPESRADETEAFQDMTEYEQQLDIKSAISALPANHQIIIYLFYFEGFSVTEIADILQKPSGTVKYQLFTARELLKSQLTSTPISENNHEY